MIDLVGRRMKLFRLKEHGRYKRATLCDQTNERRSPRKPRELLSHLPARRYMLIGDANTNAI